jgi:lipoyl-dependent peroxiredoxin
MKIRRYGSAIWRGRFKDGRGVIATEGGALSGDPYGFSSRFEGQRGGNPGESIGSAHANCFATALANILGETRLVAEQMETSAEVTLEQIGGRFAITSVHLVLKAKIPGAEGSDFDRPVAMANAGCPASKLLKVEISLDAAWID